MLVCVEENVPAEITALTGLSAAELQQGTEPREALNSFLLFIGKDPLVGHNIAFDLEFLRMTCKRYGFPAPTNRQIDLAQLARRNLTRIANYKLVTLAQHFQLAEKVEHRALPSDTTGLLQTEGNSGTIATGDTVLRDLFSLFPAYAGVIPLSRHLNPRLLTFPRIRGGDPHAAGLAGLALSFSPHMRG